MAYIFNRDDESFSILHQAYLKYTLCKSSIEVGRFELETPLISSDDYYVLSNSFQGVNLNITEIDNHLKYSF